MVGVFECPMGVIIALRAKDSLVMVGVQFPQPRMIAGVILELSFTLLSIL